MTVMNEQFIIEFIFKRFSLFYETVFFFRSYLLVPQLRQGYWLTIFTTVIYI